MTQEGWSPFYFESEKLEVTEQTLDRLDKHFRFDYDDSKVGL